MSLKHPSSIYERNIEEKLSSIKKEYIAVYHLLPKLIEKVRDDVANFRQRGRSSEMFPALMTSMESCHSKLIVMHQQLESGDSWFPNSSGRSSPSFDQVENVPALPSSTRNAAVSDNLQPQMIVATIREASPVANNSSCSLRATTPRSARSSLKPKTVKQNVPSPDETAIVSVEEVSCDAKVIPRYRCSKNDTPKVTVLKVTSPWLLWLQPNTHELNTLWSQIEAYHQNLKPGMSGYKLQAVPSAGDIVFACYSVDLQWYRARVTAVQSGGRENDMTVEVFYVDYGNTEENIPMSRLRPIPARFIDCPAHAVPCSLSQIGPKSGSGWLNEVSLQFADYILGKEYTALFSGVHGCPLIFVRLCAVEEKTDVCTEAVNGGLAVKLSNSRIAAQYELWAEECEARRQSGFCDYEYELVQLQCAVFDFVSDVSTSVSSSEDERYQQQQSYRNTNAAVVLPAVTHLSATTQRGVAGETARMETIPNKDTSAYDSGRKVGSNKLTNGANVQEVQAYAPPKQVKPRLSEEVKILVGSSAQSNSSTPPLQDSNAMSNVKSINTLPNEIMQRKGDLPDVKVTASIKSSNGLESGGGEGLVRSRQESAGSVRKVHADSAQHLPSAGVQNAKSGAMDSSAKFSAAGEAFSGSNSNSHSSPRSSGVVKAVSRDSLHTSLATSSSAHNSQCSPGTVALNGSLNSNHNAHQSPNTGALASSSTHSAYRSPRASVQTSSLAHRAQGSPSSGSVKKTVSVGSLVNSGSYEDLVDDVAEAEEDESAADAVDNPFQCDALLEDLKVLLEESKADVAYVSESTSTSCADVYYDAENDMLATSTLTPSLTASVRKNGTLSGALQLDSSASAAAAALHSGDMLYDELNPKGGDEVDSNGSVNVEGSDESMLGEVAYEEEFVAETGKAEDFILPVIADCVPQTTLAPVQPEYTLNENCVEKTVESATAERDGEVVVCLSVSNSTIRKASSVGSDVSPESGGWDVNFIDLCGEEPAVPDDVCLTVLISHVESPAKFWVNISNSYNTNAMTCLLNELHSCVIRTGGMMRHYLDSDGKQPRVGNVYCVQYSYDKRYYRAKIIEILTPSSLNKAEQMKKPDVKVLFIDFGNTEWVFSDKLLLLPPKFAAYPPLAACFSLYGIKPASGDTWSQQAVQWFKSIASTGTKKFEVFPETFSRTARHCRATESHPLQVVMIDRNSDPSNEVSVNEMLVSQGFAVQLPFEPLTTCQAVTGIREVNHDDDLKDWDPMMEDYTSARNSYKVDTDDPGVAVRGLSYEPRQRGSKRPCKFFSVGKSCWLADRCPYEHVLLGCEKSEEILLSEDHVVALPGEGTVVCAEITAAVSPAHFYLAFPFGPTPIGELPSSDAEDNERDVNICSLIKDMNEYYGKSSRRDADLLSFAGGQTVAVKSTRFSGNWYRARVTDQMEYAALVRVTYIDFGDTEWVSESSIRQLHRRFAGLPIQAVEASLPIEPTSSDHKWSSAARQFFRTITEGQILAARTLIAMDAESKLMVELYCSYNGVEFNVADEMVSNGFAVRSADVV